MQDTRWLYHRLGLRGETLAALTAFFDLSRLEVENSLSTLKSFVAAMRAQAGKQRRLRDQNRQTLAEYLASSHCTLFSVQGGEACVQGSGSEGAEGSRTLINS